MLSLLSISGLRKAFSFLGVCRKYRPHRIYFSQGDIEHSTIPILVSNILGIDSVSYLPLFYDKHSVSARYGLIRDFLISFPFFRASSYITVDSYQSQLCLNRFNIMPRVLYNYVEPINQSEATIDYSLLLKFCPSLFLLESPSSTKVRIFCSHIFLNLQPLLVGLHAFIFMAKALILLTYLISSRKIIYLILFFTMVMEPHRISTIILVYYCRHYLKGHLSF